VKDHDDGGPAFPLPFVYDPDRGQCGQYVDAADAGVPTGLTIRDWFAGQALAGLWANGNESVIELAGVFEQAASSCYQIADAMLAARKQVRG